MCVLIYTSKYNMQHLNIDFNKFKVDDSTCAKNVKNFMKPFKYNYKALSCMCFNVLYLLSLNYLHTYLLKLILKLLFYMPCDTF
jgi:hypothetical protein